ncbi:3-dehydroquinate dehydratase [Kocuria varians]|uniref:3-dehydroquinate dehydratase n=1 Tax=Kocuria varians TaxID=1272 RepID=A0A4Y4D1I2_KOCVA|nr:type II 3-dehydroquinate dehydratase [Kocuria varians]GEC99001.1 3-dehydroquinate dehydratase [Kocuria varians]
MSELPVYVLNGPNLNTLGTRRPEVYGRATLADVEANVRARAQTYGLDVVFEQSNWEGQIVEWIQQARTEACAIVINPAALTHYSVAIHDALEMCEMPIVEVHISNVHRRESFRHTSFVSPQATAVIAGAGILGYELGVDVVAQHLGLR